MECLYITFMLIILILPFYTFPLASQQKENVDSEKEDISLGSKNSSSSSQVMPNGQRKYHPSLPPWDFNCRHCVTSPFIKLS